MDRITNLKHSYRFDVARKNEALGIPGPTVLHKDSRACANASANFALAWVTIAFCYPAAAA